MFDLQKCKWNQLVAPGVIKDNASWTSLVVDCLGFKEAAVVFQLGATDIAMTDLDVQESDDNSNFVEVAAADFTDNTQLDMDGTALALPDANADNTFRIVFLDLRKRKRYLKCTATAGDGSAGSYMAAHVVLNRAREFPQTSAEIAGTSGVAVVI